ncbi:MAG: desulfoferrodoxin [Lachnospiraceae bacterium]|nr:desulfoferrodoxin [Lachnospiraceae bacterium]
MRFFICEHCGNIVEMVKDSGVNVVCCGQKMTELIPGTSDGAVEKHVPVATVDGNKVSVAVGSVDHPMLDVHFIEWIAIETSAGAQRKFLKPGEAPKAEFVLAEGESFVAAYAYCNLHGLWKA